MKAVETKKTTYTNTPLAFVKKVCSIHEKYGKANIKDTKVPNMIIPINCGNGRTTLAKKITELYYRTETIPFSSRERYLEFTLNGTAKGLETIDIEIQENAEYSTYYNGVVALNADGILSHFTDTAGQKFFDLIARIKANATLILFVPANCSEKNSAILKEKLGANSKLFAPIVFPEDQLAHIFYMALPQELFSEWLGDDLGTKSLSAITKDATFDRVKSKIEAHIKSNKLLTVKAVVEAAQALLFDLDAQEELFSSIPTDYDNTQKTINPKENI